MMFDDLLEIFVKKRDLGSFFGPFWALWGSKVVLKDGFGALGVPKGVLTDLG